MKQRSRLLFLLSTLGAITLLACTKPPLDGRDFEGDNSKIQFRGNQAELTTNGQHLVGTYAVSGNQIRLLIGSTNAVYFNIIDDRLADEHGAPLYDANLYQHRDEYDTRVRMEITETYKALIAYRDKKGTLPTSFDAELQAGFADQRGLLNPMTDEYYWPRILDEDDPNNFTSKALKPCEVYCTQKHGANEIKISAIGFHGTPLRDDLDEPIARVVTGDSQ